MEMCGLLTLVNGHWQEPGNSSPQRDSLGEGFRESCWAGERGCAGDPGAGAGRAGRPVLQYLSPVNITSENEVTVAARQSEKTLSQLQEDFLFPFFNCSSVLAPPPPIHVLRPPLHLGRGSSWMLCSQYSFGEAVEATTACKRASWELGVTPGAAVDPALPRLLGDHGKKVAAELPLVSPNKHIPSPGVMGSGRASISVLILLLVTYLGQ